ncbi:HD domain-containing phosphohydrolase [Geothrix sp. PMB-07]|uniref:HD domain-containing phosphohydrolase n=1 Tax=Geothrix sp. PMB-07 TaxID=3068640 RepID=UPI0027406C8C|nr:HD domain-containing phosphohydrolase [Geothrix sp. PMB-07]WLT33129.1 HD domain-containing phosphohydrolase [Geothrix sp. PMB-07]
MRFTVAIPPEHRNTVLDRVAGEMRRALVFQDAPAVDGPADVVLGLDGEGQFASCATWPGADAALALVKAGWERFKDRRSMERLHEVGRALASEQNLDRLMDLILTQARELLQAEAGSIYLLSGEAPKREMLFAHTQNAKVKLPFHRVTMPVSLRTLAGFVALTGQCLNIEDVYRIPADSPFTFNDSFDRQAGYRTTSVLVVPMQDTEGEVLGILQLLNRVEEDAGGIGTFSAEDERLAQSLAGQAAVAVRNAQLREEIEQLFEGFVAASVTAIEARDPVTSGHSGRVADLTVGLAEAVNATPNGVYGELLFTDRQLREIRYASLLHDFGKVGVREQVLVKAKKLEPSQLEIILQRLRQRELEQALDLLSGAWKGGEAFDRTRWDQVIGDRQAETERLMQLIRQSNEPTVMAQGVAEGLGLLEELTFTHWSGERRGLVESEDVARLRIRKGSLSEAERLEIESHVTHTFRFLERIPWTRDLAGVPEIAYAHHERLSGKGYPRQLGEPEIPVQSRAMAIADVFDALTARDRPYKGAVPLDRSLSILEEEAREGAIDRPLLDLFIEAKVFERTVPRG